MASVPQGCPKEKTRWATYHFPTVEPESEDLNLGPLRQTPTRLMTITLLVLHDKHGFRAVTLPGKRYIARSGPVGCTDFALVEGMTSRRDRLSWRGKFSGVR